MGEKKFKTVRRVEFRDTDAAGIVHFSVFFAYMEQTEHEFLRHLGLSVHYNFNGTTLSWPRVAADCNYRRAIKFEQEVEIEVWINRIGTRSVTYGFQFRESGDNIADGTVTTVCCEVERGVPPKSVDIPKEFRDLLEPFLIDASN